MGGFLGELGKRLAERWLSLLVLPGVLYLAVAAAARVLGQRDPFAVHRLTAQVTEWAKAPAATTLGGQVVLLAAVLLGAAAVGLWAQALGSFVERAVLAAGWRSLPRPLRRPVAARVEWRRRRWSAARERYHGARNAAARALATRTPFDHSERHVAHHAMTRIAQERPERPTWSGDRLHAVALRLDRDLRLDLAVVWPVLWFHVPQETRGEVTAGREAVSAAAALGGWAVPYGLLAWWWWPAAVVAAVMAVTARKRLRLALEAYAQTVEAVTRLHAGALAQQLGIEHTGVLPPEAGAALSSHLRGGAAPD
ncbi:MULTISPECIES: hypothetical protein [unclassified Streptomyces]|uniref:hypothetical protein n=1 Tax=unclassified Streptomyces TaxID=2593676 RepID=UPI00278C824F|nr:MULTISPECIES: hypothetical protein [unclassified Streptomyces]